MGNRKKITSIILNCYDFNKVLRYMTTRALTNIRRFTPEGEYELIVIDNEPIEKIPDPYKIIRLDQEKYIVNKEDKGRCASYIQGVEVAEGDYFCFTENDVFVHEGWLETLRYYLENDILDCVFPDQFGRDRKTTLKNYKLPKDHYLPGTGEAGLFMITREAYFKSGGWDERFKSIYCDKPFYLRMGNAGARVGMTLRTYITHIAGATYFTLMEQKKKYFRELEREEGRLLKEYD